MADRQCGTPARHSFTDGVDQDAFIGDARTYHAVLRNLELIDETATRVPGAIRRAHPDIPWHAIIGARNRLAYAYLHINDDMIWTMIEDAVPELVPALRRSGNSGGRRRIDGAQAGDTEIRRDADAW
ncbi:MAG: DUF86 domain-containing protein [Alphaproteobacteria bacterium]|nr:DUF86 domain-containing protein [Alphaproteobacteria bacterium]